MPARITHFARALAIAHAAAAEGPTPDPITTSKLDAPLFYQLLIGELELRSGDAGAAYQVVLDAARKTHDEELFRRATDIALQARAGEKALEAVRAWRADLPHSLEAHRYLIQLLVALNRVPDAAEPIRSLLNLTPADQQSALIMALPRFFARSTNHKQAAIPSCKRKPSTGARRASRKAAHGWLRSIPRGRCSWRNARTSKTLQPKARPCWRSRCCPARRLPKRS